MVKDNLFRKKINMKIKAKCKHHKLKTLEKKSCIHYKNKHKLTTQCTIYIMGVVQTKIPTN